MNELLVHCDINDIVSGYKIGVKKTLINPTDGTKSPKKKIARGFGSVVKHSTADPGIASSIPPHSN